MLLNYKKTDKRRSEVYAVIRVVCVWLALLFGITVLIKGMGFYVACINALESPINSTYHQDT